MALNYPNYGQNRQNRAQGHYRQYPQYPRQPYSQQPKPKEEIDWLKVSIAGAAALIMLSALFVFFVPIETHEIVLPAKIYVSPESNYVDIHNIKDYKEQLNFGGISRGYKVEKFLNLDTGGKPPAVVDIGVSGSITGFVALGRNDFLITGPTEVKVTADVPNNAEPGTYTGEVRVKYKLTVMRKILNSLNS